MEESNNTPTPTPLLGETPKSTTSKLDPKTITNRYTVVDKLGQGGMGRVYSALDAKLNRVVAIKLLPYDDFTEDQWMRFQLEAKAASKLNHPNIVQILDFGQSEKNEPYLVMEHVKGKTLSDYLKENGPFNINEAINLVSQLCQAMQQAHAKGIVHRDLKPANIIIEEGKTLRGLILDFGIAKFATDNSEVKTLTQTGQIIGSPRCISPEQALGGKVDHRADIYAMACIFYECLTGEPVFTGDNAFATIEKHLKEDPPKLSEVCHFEIPEKLELSISKALRKKPEERYQSISDFFKALTGEINQSTELNLEEHTLPNEADSKSSQKRQFIKYCAISLAFITGVISIGFLLHLKNHDGSINSQAATNENNWTDIPQLEKWKIKSPEKLVGSKAKSYAGANSEKLMNEPNLSKDTISTKRLKSKNNTNKKAQDLFDMGEKLVYNASSYDSTNTCSATNNNTIKALRDGRQRTKNAKLLILTAVDLDNKMVEEIRLFPVLEKIRFDHCSINYDTMKNLLKIKNIIKLGFKNTKITERTSDAICSADHITDVSISKSNYTDKTLLQFSNSKSLKSLNISGNKNITYEGIIKLIKVRKSNFLIRYDKNNKITKNQIIILRDRGLEMKKDKQAIDPNIQQMMLQR